ncbi:MAG: hypothetical protein A4E63_00295 [Syntrophorhabdus sp. PtaU1.Bin050]|jgi:hypothetical protein|nr:MAG: hypothetical protein A4E63_00295 [Syntrophorhabdus sp. PtaU1.Bin050]
MAYQLPSADAYYPRPNRANHKPNLDLSPDKEYQDIGWSGGKLSDGRPFRVEYWCWEGVSVLTYFMSTKGIENATDNYFRELLVDEGLLTFAKQPTLKAKKIKDASGNEMWSINVAVGDYDELFVKETLFIRHYRQLE